MPVSLLGTLTTIFIVLKLFNVIDWGWWWVISPLLLPLAFALIVFISVAIYNLLPIQKRR